MGKVYEVIDDRLKTFIEAQHVFFVGTAPSGDGGHINISPKGLDAFRILGPTTVAYVDHTGSGIETIAHIRENRRIVIMFCAFAGPPNIVRLHGRGAVVEPHAPEFDSLSALFGERVGVRAVILVQVERVSDSCGYSVPRYQYVDERTQLNEWARSKGEQGLLQYRELKNSVSIDGLPGLNLS